MNDAIIVGNGIAGCVMAWQHHFNNKNIILVGDRLKGSSVVAAGVYNPTILKRFTVVWNAAAITPYMLDFYKKIEQLTNVTLLHSSPILRRFHDQKESTTWTKKSKRIDLSPFVQQEIVHDDIYGIDAPYGYGLVPEAGWLDTIAFMNLTWSFFDRHHKVLQESFEHDLLDIQHDRVVYKNVSAYRLIFAEGFKLRHNPFFNHLPLQGNKGEVITIKVPGLQLTHTIKSSVFIMPYKDDLFWVGATYDRDDHEDQPTQHALAFLTTRLERFLQLPYEIIDHKYGIRPTTVDRRPFIGKHHTYDNVYVFNGMGSRAVLLAPWSSERLYASIYHDLSLDLEMDIKRFTV